MTSELSVIISKFELSGEVTECEIYGSGLINRTYLVKTDTEAQYILQKINTYVFNDPDGLMKNIKGVTSFLADRITRDGGDPMRQTLNLILTKSGESYLKDDTDDSIWRVYVFISDATAYDRADRAGLLYEAARSFGVFQRQLSDYPAETLCETIPNFHNTAARYEAFETAVAADEAGRAASVALEIEKLRAYRPYASMITDALSSGRIPVRVTHNDTKLNNILIDNATGKGLCVIDLDTVMPGSLLYDFGDSVRFAANNGAEDDRELDRVWLRPELFEEYVSGFLAGVEDSILPAEIEMLPESVLVLTYELALRFMTDYLNGDKYFKVRSEDHNIVRTRAQIKLVEDIESKLGLMHEITEKYVK